MEAPSAGEALGAGPVAGLEQQPTLNQQSAATELGIRPTLKSKYRGLSWDKKYEGWRVRIYFGGKQRHVGRYADEVTAAKAYDKAAVYLYSRNAITNFGLEACQHDTTTEVSDFIITAKTIMHEQPAGDHQPRQRGSAWQRQQQAAAAAAAAAPYWPSAAAVAISQPQLSQQAMPGFAAVACHPQQQQVLMQQVAGSLPQGHFQMQHTHQQGYQSQPQQLQQQGLYVLQAPQQVTFVQDPWAAAPHHQQQQPQLLADAAYAPVPGAAPLGMPGGSAVLTAAAHPAAVTVMAQPDGPLLVPSSSMAAAVPSDPAAGLQLMPAAQQPQQEQQVWAGGVAGLPATCRPLLQGTGSQYSPLQAQQAAGGWTGVAVTGPWMTPTGQLPIWN